MSHAEHAAQNLSNLRGETPLVQNITNYVSMDVAANALLAVGASPAMVHAVEEAAEFTRLSRALVLNVGTLSPRWVEAMHQSAAAARELGIPVVLDPVGAGATRYRTEVSLRLLKEGVSVLRGNASEVLALAGAATSTRGVDSVHGSHEAADAAAQLAKDFSCVVAVTGAVDLVTDGARRTSVHGGHPLMAKVTATGCAASAVVGAFCASRPEGRTIMDATVAALAVYGLAGARAAEHADGPGSFRVRFMDALFALTPEDVVAGARIEA